ncbi:MAG: TetR/AcrR family transcriptional regulator, partial [Methanobrevibacter sp.]|nr:TetR/AcrR family transcriptional regulator [Methanobrevibacter sp.]
MKKVDTKEKIFNVSLELFSQKGYNEVSMREIAKSVGIREASIYYHYSKKEEVLQKIFDYFMDRMYSANIDDSDFNDYLNESPFVLYHMGSLGFKECFKSIKMLKILRLMFIELNRNEKIREFFLKMIMEVSLEFWTFLFRIMQEKKIIQRDENPNKLAKRYFYYGMFKIYGGIILKYSGDLKTIDIDKIFKDI